MPLKLAIAASGRTQRVIAQRTGIEETRLSRIVRSQVSPFPHEKRALARVLRSSIRTLFVRPVPPVEPNGHTESLEQAS